MSLFRDFVLSISLPPPPQVVEKDLQIVEKEKVYMEVKAMLARQPGPEVAEQVGWIYSSLWASNMHLIFPVYGHQVNVYKSQLKEKTKQLKVRPALFLFVKRSVFFFTSLPLPITFPKWSPPPQAMASELNMYQAQVAEYKFEIERVERDLDSLKRKYYAQRRKEQIRKWEGDYSFILALLLKSSFQISSIVLLSSFSGLYYFSFPGTAMPLKRGAEKSCRRLLRAQDMRVVASFSTSLLAIDRLRSKSILSYL